MNGDQVDDAAFDRELTPDGQALTARLEALAEAQRDSAPSDALEARLMALFDEQTPGRPPFDVAPVDLGSGSPEPCRGAQGVPTLRQAQGRPEPRRGTSASRGADSRTSGLFSAWWMRAAAVFAVVAVVGAAWLLVAPGSRSAVGTPPVARPADVGRTSMPAQTPGAAVQTPQPARDLATSSAMTTRALQHRPGIRRAVHVVTAEGFVPLPWAGALPDFESGNIVRIDIPLTALPLYGIDIPPDAAEGPVRADVLVGQDGQARAIRLVARQGDATTMNGSRR